LHSSVRTFLAAVALCLAALAPGAASANEPPWLTGQSQGDDLVITLITFGPGDDVASWFGHTALTVEDRRLQHGRLYNYGMFNFDSTMLARFAMGRLEFWVGDASIGGTLRAYQAENREVRIQELNLSSAKKLALARSLAENVLPQNRNYLYHHYDDNCSTRPRDMIDRVIGNALSEQMKKTPARYSLRGHTRRYAAVDPPMSLLLDFLQNDVIDRPITRLEEGFLPDELYRQVEEISYTDENGQRVRLVKSARTFYKSDKKPTPEAPPNYVPWTLAIGLGLGGAALGLCALGLRRRIARVGLGILQLLVGFIFGLPGLALFIMWMVTEHVVTYRNESLFVANPLTFAAGICSFMVLSGSRRGIEWSRWLWLGLAGISVLGLVVKVIPVFNQDTWPQMALLMPMNLGFAAGYYWNHRRESGSVTAQPSAASSAEEEENGGRRSAANQ
jgi:hypothetical protein